MPELPEVETVVQSIRNKLIGNEFVNIEFDIIGKYVDRIIKK